MALLDTHTCDHGDDDPYLVEALVRQLLVQLVELGLGCHDASVLGDGATPRGRLPEGVETRLLHHVDLGGNKNHNPLNKSHTPSTTDIHKL